MSDDKTTYRNDKLKSLRKAAGLSQTQLAEMAGLNFRTLQHYEQGTKDLNAAKLQTLLKLCNTLNCDLFDIITDPIVLELLAVYERERVTTCSALTLALYLLYVCEDVSVLLEGLRGELADEGILLMIKGEDEK